MLKGSNTVTRSPKITNFQIHLCLLQFIIHTHILAHYLPIDYE